MHGLDGDATAAAENKGGGSAKGRKLEQPVYCYSLSWAPGGDPSQSEMLGAAMDTLKALGLADHEALFVGLTYRHAGQSTRLDRSPATVIQAFRVRQIRKTITVP